MCIRDRLNQILKTVELVRKKLNPQLELEGVVFTMYEARTNLSLQVVESVKSCLLYTSFRYWYLLGSTECVYRYPADGH